MNNLEQKQKIFALAQVQKRRTTFLKMFKNQIF